VQVDKERRDIQLAVVERVDKKFEEGKECFDILRVVVEVVDKRYLYIQFEFVLADKEH